MKVAVCGTRFGQLWIDTLWISKIFHLVAVIARGSGHSEAVCKRYGVPLLRKVDSVRGPVDAAVVAVGGPAGEHIAREWLKRGVPVLLEQPVRHSFLRQVNGRERAKAHLFVNGHFSELSEVRKFLRLCSEGTRKLKTFTVSFTATERTLYSCLDIIVELLTEEQVAALLQIKMSTKEHPGSLRLGPMRLIPTLIPENGDEDTPAASIGGHLIECWLPQTRVILVGPTGPVVTLNADNVAPTMWDFHATGRSVDWRSFSYTTRPAALLQALRRLVKPCSKQEIAARCCRDLLVGLLCRRIFDARR